MSSLETTLQENTPTDLAEATIASVAGTELPAPVDANADASEEFAGEAAGTPQAHIESLGRDIVARIEQGDKAKDRADQMYKSAGLMLIKARKDVPNFTAFLRDYCDGLSRSRAYELIDYAEGKGDQVRSKNRTRDRRRRENATRVRGSRTRRLSIPQPPPAKSQAQRALAEFKVAVDIWFAKMDDEAKRAAVVYVNSMVSRMPS